MRTIIATKVKAIVTIPTGDIAIKLSDGTVFGGKLTEGELEQIAHRVTAISNGQIKFEPPAKDILEQYGKDVKTLETQAIRIDELENELKKKPADLSAEVALLKKQVAELTDSNAGLVVDLVTARSALRETKINNEAKDEAAQPSA